MKKCCNKNCAQVDIDQPLSNFYPRNDGSGRVSARCKECAKIYARYWAAILNPTAHINNTREWAHRNPAKARKNSKKWADAHPEEVRAHAKRWAHNHPDKANAQCSLRRARKLQAVPKWLTEDQKLQIKFMYTCAKYISWRTGLAIEVDHILPLKGKDVSGLHVPWNLQLLTASQNASKNNKIKPYNENI